MDIKSLMAMMADKKASDLYLSTGAAPTLKIEGEYCQATEEILAPGTTKIIANELMTNEKQIEFEENWEVNFAYALTGSSRFRVNVFMQRNEIALVIRCIKVDIPDLDSLGIPGILKELVMKKNGLILFAGATGAGKSTSLASLICYRSQNQEGHIITIEDPIEFLHQHSKSIVNQREIGIDTKSYKHSLENALRQAPDAILIGEARDMNAMQYAMTFAETGHLCFTTLHAHNANQTIERVVNFFPPDQHQQLLIDLSFNLTAIISQRLLKTTSKKRIAVFEILINTPLVADLIKRNDISSIREVMQKSEHSGMQTFDSGLFNLVKQGIITKKEALANADSANNLKLKLTLAEDNMEKMTDFTLEDGAEEKVKILNRSNS